MHKKWAKQTSAGFTIVELLIVIVVIGILAAIMMVSYNGIQDRARQSKIDTDLSMMIRAVELARINKSSNLFTITNDYTDSYCWSLPSGTDLAALPKTHACWERYNNALRLVSDASGMDIRNLVDPWGRPYVFNENEGEGDWARCTRDQFGVYSRPFTTSTPPTSIKRVELYTNAC